MRTSGPILVAGATGALGRRVVDRLLEAGEPVRVLVRDRRRLGPVADRVEVHVADARRAPLHQAARGARAVFSALGASVQPRLGAGRPSYGDVDVPANLRLLEAARAAGTPRFIYVSLLLSPRAASTAYVRAHERVVAALRACGLDACALRPTGFHSVFLSMLDLASRGRVPLFGDGSARTNPIADDDLAAAAVELLRAEGPLPAEVPLGGPEVLTRRRVAELACEAAGRGAVLSLPPGLGRAMAWLMGPVSPRMRDLLRFALAVGEEDAIGPARGRITLAETFAAEMARRRGARALTA